MHTGSGSWSRKSKSPRDSSEIEQPPERLKKKFKSVKYIDGGSYGSVWAVEDQQLRKMAIKSQKYDGDEDGIPGNLIRELAALARLSHPNIVNLEKVWHGKSESSVDMMLPYFAQDLNAWIRKMEWKVRLGSMEAVFEQLLDVLCAIHENDIQHLDIKSANILVQDDKVSLCDFGLCSLDSLDAFQNVTLCSANYRPPELLARCIVEKSKKTLERVDVWSMGCVFVEYILGFHPFNRGEDAPQTLLAILRYSVPVEELRILRGHRKRYKNIWKTLKMVVPEWYQLLRGMLNIRSENRLDAFQCWQQFYTITKGKYSRLSYHKHILKWTPTAAVHHKALVLMAEVCCITGASAAFSTAIKIYAGFCGDQDPKDMRTTSICCAYLAVKFRNYRYASLMQLLGDEEQRIRVLSLECSILSACRYLLE